MTDRARTRTRPGVSARVLALVLSTLVPPSVAAAAGTPVGGAEQTDTEAGGAETGRTENGSTESKAPPQLAPFDPFLDTTWKALVDPDAGVYDVARWQRAIGGQAIRIVHSVGRGAYGGETIVMWDRTQQTLVYYYFTTGGFYTHGTMSFDGAGRLISRETVEGHETGVTEVRANQELLADGRLSVRTRMLRNGVWEDRGEVVYVADADAELVLPNE